MKKLAKPENLNSSHIAIDYSYSYLARCVSLPAGKELCPVSLMHHETSLVPVSLNSACAYLVIYLFMFLFCRRPHIISM